MYPDCKVYVISISSHNRRLFLLLRLLLPLPPPFRAFEGTPTPLYIVSLFNQRSCVSFCVKRRDCQYYWSAPDLLTSDSNREIDAKHLMGK